MEYGRSKEKQGKLVAEIPDNRGRKDEVAPRDPGPQQEPGDQSENEITERTIARQ
jgi:hypothetical protein